MRKPAWIAIAVAVAIVIAAGVLVVVTDPWQWRTPSTPGAVVPSTPAAIAEVDGPGGGAPEEAAAVLRALPTDPVAGAASTVRDLVAADPETAVPPGATIEAQPSTWISTGPDSGTIAMAMTVPGEASPRAYIAGMVFEEGAWKLESTIEAEPGG
jgi:hypothetical protein